MPWDRDVVTSFEDWFDYDRDRKLNILEETEMYESMEREYMATMDSLPWGNESFDLNGNSVRIEWMAA